MPDPWPWPDDDVLTRARRVTQEYRARLIEHAPEVCAQLDELVSALGQTWVTGVEISDDPAMTTTEAAAFLGITPRGVRLAVKRGTLSAAGRDAGGYLFERPTLVAYLARSRTTVA